ncbi:von Willebrand factor A-like protein [Gracilaria domingensis]|nr:von Willebrand factor A-like protein [Gracilaria domingensis]
MAASRAVLLYASFLLAVAFAADESIIPTARCPPGCEADVSDAFSKCSRYFTIGCTLIPCSSGGFKCGIHADADVGTVLPGGEVVIDGLDVYDWFKFQVNLNASHPLRTDFYLLSDATGSMSEEIAEVKSRFNEIVGLYEHITDAHFGVGYYRDEAESGMDNGFKNVQALTGDRRRVYNAINSLRATGGGDDDEANLVAMHKVATDSSIGWRHDSRKILVYFGDYPGHEPTCVEGRTITRDTVIRKLKAKEITVVAASFTPGLDGTPISYGCSSGSAGGGQGTEIATDTGGALFQNADVSGFIDRLKGAVTNLRRKYDLDASDCMGKLTASSEPPFPVYLEAHDSKVVEQFVRIEPGVCAGGANFECDLRYTEGGASLPPTRLRVVNIRGCPSV